MRPNKQGIQQKIWLLAWPLMLSNITQPLLGLVDTALLGHLPSQVYIGACALGASILTLLFWGFGFLRMGTTSHVAQALGEDNPAAGEKALAQNCLLALGLALMILLLGPFLLPLAISAMNASSEVSALALSYSQTRLWSAPATLLNYALLGWFIGRQLTKLPLIILLVTNAANIGFDLLFIVYWDFRSLGAAWASVLSEYIGLIVAIGLYLRRKPTLSLSFIINQPGRWRSVLTLNQHLFVRTCCLMFVLLFFTSQGAQFGDTILASNAILLQLVHLASYALDGLAHAAEALTGQAKGQKRADRLWQLLINISSTSFVVAVVMGAGFWFSQQSLIPLFSDIEAVTQSVSTYFFWCALLPAISVGAYVLDGYCIGAGETQAMRNSLLFSCFMVFLPLWYLTTPLGNHGLWFAFAVFNLVRGISLAYLVIPPLRSQLRLH
ncbi:MATE family efflux transporter [Simiduia curdlanivorans]|uniref:MATE family efflux transporter n=1 Tax=Simiduia curdlanivorans TaxID=1492769 RepID=A0ABV8UZT9_9GAMM|nr:MATE family efflux transporter [Simiduia curdlanivorans]MDN3638024.1 MATE family efflux transporter [Simiduia curdlanivorans]